MPGTLNLSLRCGAGARTHPSLLGCSTDTGWPAQEDAGCRPHRLKFRMDHAAATSYASPRDAPFEIR
jgi:hypothetical protein